MGVKGRIKKEINFRIDLDSFNDHFSMIELYTKPVDQLTNTNYLFYTEDINVNEQAELKKSNEELIFGALEKSRRDIGAPEKSRTPNLQIRSLALYPIELRAQNIK